MVTRLSLDSHKMVTRWYKTRCHKMSEESHKIVTRWSQDSHKIVQDKMSQDVTRWSQDGQKIVTRLSQDGQKMSLDGHKMVSRCHKMVSWSHVSPGEGWSVPSLTYSRPECPPAGGRGSRACPLSVQTLSPALTPGHSASSDSKTIEKVLEIQKISYYWGESH